MKFVRAAVVVLALAFAATASAEGVDANGREVAPSNATSGQVDLLQCCGAPCCIRGFQEENEWVDCTFNCRNNGGTVNGCLSTCCNVVAGCYNCGVC